MKIKRILSFSLLFACLLTTVEAKTLNDYTVVSNDKIDWYADKETEVYNGQVYIPPKLARFKSSAGTSYGTSWLWRTVRDQHGYKIHYYGTSIYYPNQIPTNAGSYTNLDTVNNMPENNRWFEAPDNSGSQYKTMCYDFSKYNSSNKWKNFKTCGTLPNYYGNSTSPTYKHTGYHLLDSVYGEFRYLGYSSDGNAITNPYMPADVAYNAGATPGKYPYREIIGKGVPENTKLNITSASFYTTKYDDTSYTSYYNLKLKAIEDLLKVTSNGMAAKGDKYYWAPRLSLQTNPQWDTPVFIGALSGSTIYYTEVVGANRVFSKDLIMQEIALYDKETGKLIAKSVRDNSGVKDTYNTSEVENRKLYTVKMKVYNAGLENTSLIPSLADIQILTGTNVDVVNNRSWSTIQSPNGIGAKSSVTYEYDFYLSDTQTGKLGVHSKVNSAHFSYGDNSESDNDNLSLKLNIKNNPMKSSFVKKGVEIRDTNGKIVDKIEMGEEYELVYKYQYTGDDRYTYIIDGYDKETNNPIYKKHYYTYYIPGTGTIKQQIGPNEYSTSTFTDICYKSDDPDNSYITLEYGDMLYFKSPLKTYVRPYFDTEFSIHNYKELDVTRENTKQTYSHKEEYDMKITSIKVYPVSTTPRDLQSMDMAVEYTINYKVPSGIREDHAALIKNKLSIGGTTREYEDLILPGNNTFVRTVTTNPNVDNRPDFVGINPVTLEANLSININGKSYEYSSSDVNQNNNKISTVDKNTGAKYIKTNLGVNGDKAMLSRSITYREIDYSVDTKVVNYGNTRTYNFYRKKSVSNKQIGYTDFFKISKVEFKSKYTEDNDMGDDGWVELSSSYVNGNKTGNGIIKAGYGFKLRITTDFNAPSSTANLGKDIPNRSHESVRPAIPADITVIYDGKTYTATGVQGSSKDFSRKIYGPDNKLLSKAEDVQYHGKYVFETTGTNKIYVEKDKKNQDTELIVRLPVVNGISYGQDTITLGGQNTYTVTIKGSYLDDVNPHLDN